MGVPLTKGIINHRFAGLVGIPLPPAIPVEKPAHLVHAFLRLVEQDVADQFAACFVNRRHRAFAANAEAGQKFLRFLKVVCRFTVLHGFRIPQNVMEIGGVLRGKVTDDHPWRFYVHQFSRSFPALSPNSSVFYTFMNPQQPISDSSRKPMD